MYLLCWLVINENNQPLFGGDKNKSGKGWLFFSKEEAQRFIDSPSRKIDRDLGKIRKIVRAKIVYRDLV